MVTLIEGVVADGEGRAIPRASVYVVSAPVAMPEIAARTDAGGRFTLSAPAPGTYTLAAAAEGFTTASAAVTVEASAATAAIAIILHRARES